MCFSCSERSLPRWRSPPGGFAFAVRQRFGGRCPSRRLWFVSTGRRLNPCRAVTVRVYVVRTLLVTLRRYRARDVYPRSRV